MFTFGVWEVGDERSMVVKFRASFQVMKLAQEFALVYPSMRREFA